MANRFIGRVISSVVKSFPRKVSTANLSLYVTRNTNDVYYKGISAMPLNDCFPFYCGSIILQFYNDEKCKYVKMKIIITNWYSDFYSDLFFFRL